MNKTMLKTSAISIAVIGLLAIGTVAMADTVTGNLSTGISATVGTTVNGVVIAPPVASPAAGVYATAQNVTLTAPGASSIDYTTDGVTIPTCSSGTVYSGPVAVNSSLVIEAISCYPGNASSTVASYLYAIDPVSPSGGSSYSAAPDYGGGGGGGGGNVSSDSSGSSSSGGSSATSLFSKGDANGDGKIDINDFVILLTNWGQPGQGNPADFSGDATVGIQDFVILMTNWNG